MKLDIKYVKSATMLAEELYGPEEYVEEECYSDEEDPYRDFEEPQDEMQYLEALVGETDEMKEEKPQPVQKAQITSSPPHPNECSICMDVFTEEELVRIKSCRHTFCKDCLQNYITFKTSDASCIYHHVTLIRRMRNGTVMHIEDLKVYGVLCPSHGCKHVMMVDEIVPLVASQVVDQFQRFSKVHEENLKRIEELRQVQARKKEIICVCCGEVNVITKKGHRGKLPCKKCRRPFCSSCGHNHSVGLSCTAWIEALGQGVAEAMQLMRHLGLARCPKCNMFAEKVAGCNFMTCRCSANFCFLCSAALDQTKHYSHFKGAPFGDSCLGPRDAVRLLNKK